MELLAQAPVGVLNQGGAAISESNSRFQCPEALFRRHRAVARIRRLAVSLPSSSCSLFQPWLAVTVPQRLVDFTSPTAHATTTPTASIPSVLDPCSVPAIPECSALPV